MASIIETCNAALTKLGSSRITSLNDNTKQARSMSARYDAVRRAEIRRHRWSFSIARALLPAMVDVPAYGFPRQFQLPADLLRIDQISKYWFVTNLVDYVNGPADMWQIESDKILTHLGAPLPIRFAKDITDPNLWDAAFVESLASRLAYEACEDLTQSSTKKQDMLADYKMSITEATRANAIERPPEMLPDDSWMISRL